MTAYNNGPAFSPSLPIQITSTGLGAGGPLTALRQSSLPTPQMDNPALPDPHSPGPEMLWTGSPSGVLALSPQPAY